MIKLISFLFFLSFYSNADSFKFEIDNDILTQTDYYYSNGILIEYENSKLGIYLPWRNLGKHDQSGISIKHDISTPTDTAATDVQENDYPYSAVLYSTFFSYQNNSNFYKKREILIGFIGPMAFGEQIQNGIHGIFPSHSVNGWDNQLSNDLLLNYNYEYWKKNTGEIFTHGSWFRAEAGTFKSQFHFAYKAQMNFFKRHSFELLGGGYLNFYDAKLQGGVFSNNTHDLKTSEIDTFVYEANIAYKYTRKHHQISIGNTFLGVQFDGGKPHSWTSFSYKYIF
jgi:hypothetical protein